MQQLGVYAFKKWVRLNCQRRKICLEPEEDGNAVSYHRMGNLRLAHCEASPSEDNGVGVVNFPGKRKRFCLYNRLPASQGVLLDDDLWSRLPLELLERVIGNLPIDAMLRFRSVCKAWKAYISSCRFAELCYGAPSKGPWCLAIISDFKGIAVYDVTLDKWYQLPLPSAAAKHNMQPFGSGGSFVCFKTFDNRTFFVYNTLTRSCSALTPRRFSMGSDKDKVWVVTDQSEGFIVVVVRESRRYEVYDSYSHQWSKFGMLPPDIQISKESCIPNRSVSSGGTLYMVSEFPHDLVTYDTITGAWSKLYVRWPEDSWNHILSEYRGRVYMLALQRGNGIVSFCEWELSLTRMSWVKVETMPTMFWHEVFGKENNDWHIQSLANKDLVLLQFVNTNAQEYLVLYNRILKLWIRTSPT